MDDKANRSYLQEVEDSLAEAQLAQGKVLQWMQGGRCRRHRKLLKRLHYVIRNAFPVNAMLAKRHQSEAMRTQVCGYLMQEPKITRCHHQIIPQQLNMLMLHAAGLV